MKARLATYQDGEIDMVFPLSSTRITLGRDTDNVIQLPDDQVSKHHAVIHRAKDNWAIEDLQSRNGLFINGKRTVRAELKEGDRIRIGPFEFTFETHITSADFVPSHIIDVSTHIGHPTMIARRPPPQS